MDWKLCCPVITNNHLWKTQIFREQQLQIPLFRLYFDRIFSKLSFLDFFPLFCKIPLAKIFEIFHLFTKFRIDLLLIGWLSTTHFRRFHFVALLWPSISANKGKECPFLLKNRLFFDSYHLEIFSKTAFLQSNPTWSVPLNHPSVIPPVFFKTTPTCFEFHISQSFIGVVFFKIVILHYLWYNKTMSSRILYLIHVSPSLKI